MQKFTGKMEPVEVMRVLRKEMDKFKKPKERLPPQAMLALQWGLLMSSKDHLSPAIKDSDWMLYHAKDRGSPVAVSLKLRDISGILFLL